MYSTNHKKSPQHSWGDRHYQRNKQRYLLTIHLAKFVPNRFGEIKAIMLIPVD